MIPAAVPTMISTRVARLTLFAATPAVVACLWFAWCEFPFYAWNEVRLAPAFAVRHGINPYPPLGGGPLSTWIYGPVGALINLPATFALTVAQALHTACVINLLTVMAPLAVIFFGSGELRSRGILFCWLALAIAMLFVPRPNLVLQVPDHSATMFGLLSCWCLARTPQPRGAWLAAAGALCALAVWSKQIALFVLPGQLAFLWLRGQRGAAVRYLVWVSGFALMALAVFVPMFGWKNLWLNLVAIPGRLGWAEFWPRLTMRPLSLVAQLLLPAIGLIAWWRVGRWPSPERESGRFFSLAVSVAIAMTPIGIAALFKIGGDTNLIHGWTYLLPGVLLAWLSREDASTGAAMRLVAVVVCGLGLRSKDLLSLPARPFTTHFEVAQQLMGAHPHSLWFPQNPLMTFYADGRLWHSEDGISTRYLADFGLREPDFRRHLPPKLEGVVYPSIVEFPFAMPLLPEFSHQSKLPYWTLHARAPATAAQLAR